MNPRGAFEPSGARTAQRMARPRAEHGRAAHPESDVESAEHALLEDTAASARPRRHRAVVLAAPAVAALVVALVGWQVSRPDSVLVTRSDIETAVVAAARDAGFEGAEVECASGVADAEASTRCEVTEGTGAATGVIVGAVPVADGPPRLTLEWVQDAPPPTAETAVDAEGDGVAPKPEDLVAALGTVEVHRGHIAASVAASAAFAILADAAGIPPDDVTCPDDLVAEVDASMTCTLHHDGTTRQVTVTVTSVDATHAVLRARAESQDPPRSRPAQHRPGSHRGY